MRNSWDDKQKIIYNELVSSGKLPNDKCELYMRDITTAILGFAFKLKAGMTSKNIFFFKDYYVPSNTNMENFNQKEAQIVFQHCIGSFRLLLCDSLVLGSVYEACVVEEENDDLAIYF